MSDLELDPAVSRLVTAWLDKHDPDSNPNEVPTEVLDFTPRPARLGLGAKYVPHRPSISKADRRLGGELRRHKLDSHREQTETVDNIEEVDSRAQVVVQKRRGPGRPRKHPRPQTPNPFTAKPKNVEGLVSAADSDDDFGRPEQNAGIANGTIHNGQEHDTSSGELRKRKKIRSRQKNLKRDNRPKDQLPPHLTEETLLGGRVRKEDTPISEIS